MKELKLTKNYIKDFQKHSFKKLKKMNPLKFLSRIKVNRSSKNKKYQKNIRNKENNMKKLKLIGNYIKNWQKSKSQKRNKKT